MLRNLFSRLFSRDLNIPRELLENIRELEGIISYRFRDKHLLIQALTHRSYTSKQGNGHRTDSNERLEFLGDSVLNFIIGKFFFKKYPEMQEGQLTKMRSVLVSGENLSNTAKDIDLGKFILLSEFEERSGGRDKNSILEDCMEALIGAVYLDGGIERSEKVINILILSDKEGFSDKSFSNYKSELLELVQSKGFPPPTYETVSTEGPEHEKTFTVNALVNGRIIAEGQANSKKKAEQESSAEALKKISCDVNFLDSLRDSDQDE